MARPITYPVNIVVTANGQNSGKIQISANNDFTFNQIRFFSDKLFSVQIKNSSDNKLWFDNYVDCRVLGNTNWYDTTGKSGLYLLTMDQAIRGNSELIIDVKNLESATANISFNFIGQQLV